jgi:hypothetical protein
VNQGSEEWSVGSSGESADKTEEASIFGQFVQPASGQLNELLSSHKMQNYFI